MRVCLPAVYYCLSMEPMIWCSFRINGIRCTWYFVPLAAHVCAPLYTEQRVQCTLFNWLLRYESQHFHLFLFFFASFFRLRVHLLNRISYYVFFHVFAVFILDNGISMLITLACVFFLRSFILLCMPCQTNRINDRGFDKHSMHLH